MGPDKNELLIVPNSEITLEVTNPETLERSIEAIHVPLSNLLKSAFRIPHTRGGEPS